MVYPALVLADTQGLVPSPVTAALSVGDWVVDKVMPKTKQSLHTPERQAKFDRWSKEDWIKDDPYACMWEKDWITKYKDGTCK